LDDLGNLLLKYHWELSWLKIDVVRYTELAELQYHSLHATKGTLPIPKSVIEIWPLLSRRIFAGFRSLWMIPA